MEVDGWGGAIRGHLPAAILPPPIDPNRDPLGSVSLAIPPPNTYTHTRPPTHPTLTNHQALFPKRFRFVLTGVGFQRYSKLSVILMISLRGRDSKMNRFSLSLLHNCERETERGSGKREREAVHIDVCIRAFLIERI